MVEITGGKKKWLKRTLHSEVWYLVVFAQTGDSSNVDHQSAKVHKCSNTGVCRTLSLKLLQRIYQYDISKSTFLSHTHFCTWCASIIALTCSLQYLYLPCVKVVENILCLEYATLIIFLQLPPTKCILYHGELQYFHVPSVQFNHR